MPFTSASFTPNLHHRHIDHWSRTISKKKEFLLCPLLPPLGLCRPLLAQTSTTPHTEAHRHRGTVVSHDPKVCFSWFSLFPNLDFELGVRIFCLLHQNVSNFEHFLYYENGGWVYVHILYCSNERCCVGFWYDLGFVWFLNWGRLIDLIKLDSLLDKLALNVQCDGIEFGNDSWILNWNLLWRSWQLCWKFQYLFYFFTSGFLLGCYSCIMLIRLILCFLWFLLL